MWKAQIGYPCFVKPANSGSSIGTTKVRSREDLADAMTEAFRFDRKALVEQAIEGRQVECAVLGNDHPQASPLGEIVFTREFYDYVAKYEDPTTRLIIPAELPPDLARGLQAMAIAAFQAIDCAGMGRVDFFLGPDGQPYLNEINTIPGFTPVSMYPKLWEAAGLSYRDLITRLIELGLERHQREAASCLVRTRYHRPAVPCAATSSWTRAKSPVAPTSGGGCSSSPCSPCWSAARSPSTSRPSCGCTR